jgi:hypothetical protein
MGWGKRWAEYRERWRAQRARERGRVRLTFQTCRRCRRSALLPISRERPLCGGCRNQQ